MIHETWRTFVALPLPLTMIRELADIQRQLKRLCPPRSVRWVPPANVHLTLAFLGEILPTRVPAVRAALSSVARNLVPFSFAVTGLGAFPNVRRPRVVWVGLRDPDGRLELVYQAVNEALTSVGFMLDQRPFKPHLTLGRVGRRTSRQDAQLVGEAVTKAAVGELGEVRAEQMIFFRSVLKSDGAEYTALHTFPFSAG